MLTRTLCRSVAAPFLTSDNAIYVNQTGVNLALEWKDGFNNAMQERTLEAVRCSAV
jgi:hypothetical protein